MNVWFKMSKSLRTRSRAPSASRPFSIRAFFKAHGYSLFLANPSVGCEGLATRPRSVFTAYVVANSFPSRIRLSASFSTPFAACRLLAA